MSMLSSSGPWAVYQMSLKGKPEVVRVVCEQREWDKMESAQPGQFQLIRGGITNEAEAERLARETPAAPAPDELRIPPRS